MTNTGEETKKVSLRGGFALLAFACLLFASACSAQKPKGPPTWPSDIPLYPKGELTEKVIKGDQYKREYLVEMMAEPIVKYYREKLPKSHWEEIAAFNREDEGWMLIFEKNERRLQITVEPDGELRRRVTLFVFQ